LSTELARLSKRERQVAELVGEGFTDREVAEKLRIKPRTAEWHVEQILNKLDLRSRSQLAAAVAREQAIDPSLETDQPRLGLPPQLSTFVGRQSELVELRGLLLTTRLLTLTGTPGVGKTRLALELASRSRSDFPAGVWFVDLAAVTEEAQVPRAVAAAIGVAERQGRPLAQSLADRLGSNRHLLVLDNCEHVIAAIASMSDLLLGLCRGPRLLATSREALRIPAETTWRVVPLPITEAAHMLGLEKLSEVDSIHLFLDRAQQTDPGFRLTEDNAAAVAELCRRLDGLPLAIELAAARADMMSPAELLKHLNPRFQLLNAGSRIAPPRQRTMEAAIDWSHGLLTEEEAGLFRRLSVFAGSFGLESAEMVITIAAPDGRVLPALGGLVEKSLVVPSREVGEHTRYRLHETLRQYARERLEAAGEESRLTMAHMVHFLDLAEYIGPLLWTSGLSLAQRLDLERDNLRAALNEALLSGGEYPLRLVVALRPYWTLRGHIVESREVVAKALERGTGDPDLRCRALAVAGHLAIYAADHIAAADYAEQAAALARTIAPSFAVMYALYVKGLMAVNRRQFEAAVAIFDECKAIAASLAPEHSIFPMHGLYMARILAGDVVAGRRLSDEILRIFDEVHYPYLYCFTHCTAALYECAAGSYAETKRHLETALRMARRWGITYWGGWGIQAACYIAAVEQQYERGWVLFGASEVLRDHTHFAISGPGGRLDDLLIPARTSMTQDAIQELVRAGKAMTANEAFDIALQTIV
jgi:predicted ATPase/DNA-binding CsgD family transcriptional regulator